MHGMPSSWAADLLAVYAAGRCISACCGRFVRPSQSRRRDLPILSPATRVRKRVVVLAEGLITAALFLRPEATSKRLIRTMIDTIRQPSPGVILRRTAPFEIVTPESP